MQQTNHKKKRQFKNVGTATALTITLVTSNVSTLVYANELPVEITTVTSIEKEDIKEEVAVQEEVTVQEEVAVQEESATQEQQIGQQSGADQFDLNQWDYKEYTTDIILNKYNGKDTDIVIPGEINGKKVKMGTMNCFLDIQSTMTSLTFKEENGKKVQAPNNISAATFENYEALESVDFSGLDTSSTVMNMGNMFSGCTSLVSLEFGGIDTSSVTSMGNMFNGCTSLMSVDFSGIDTSSVKLFVNYKDVTKQCTITDSYVYY